MAAAQHLLSQLLYGGADVITELAAHAAASDDVTVLVAAALLSPDPAVLMAQATAAATTTEQRQLLAIAAAHLDGDGERVDALARDHLADHPSSVLVAWISARSHTSDPTPKDPT
jgi:NAD(P)H-hydrate repair Nnr-like enzyme with NAD(P)H-hydrate dehydratase domain